jgi:ABC-2 type transport system permease protein
MLKGVGALVRKELINFLREPKSAFMIFFPIVLFLTLFVFASNKDVENSSVVIFNQDNGKYSIDLLEEIVNTKIFKETLYVNNEKDLKKVIDVEKAFIGILFPQNFSKNLALGKIADVMVINDGRRTNAATIAYGYFLQAFARFQNKLPTSAIKNIPKVSVKTWYNPNKNVNWFSITNMVCIIIISQAIMLVSLSISREKEEGTFDQLLVSPIKPFGMLVGKMIPSIAISMFMGLCIMFAGNIFFGVPIRGSLLLILFSMTIYVISVVGIGVCISAFANTQQQAMLGGFLVQMPVISLSGFMSPTESVTNPLMKIFIKCNPVVYANRLIKGAMLKDISLQSAMKNIYPLMIIGIVVLSVAGIVFCKKHRLKIF